MNPTSTPMKARLCAAITALMLVACGGESQESLQASGKSYLDKGDHKAAIIQLKSALQKGETSQLRFLLGKALLMGGDPRLASIELAKASELNHPLAEVAPLLARAQVEQGLAAEVLKRFGQPQDLGNPDANAELDTMRAWAFGMSGDIAAMQQATERALAAKPGHPPARLLQARALMVKRDIDGGMRVVDEVLAQVPTDHDAWLLKGDVLARVKGDADGARQAFEKALLAQPNSRNAHTGLVTLAMAAKDWPGAAKRLEAMKAARGNDPQVKYLEAQAAYSRGDMKAGRDLAAQLLKIAPEHPGVLEIAGGVELQLRSYVQAQALLHKALQADPNLRVARLLLAQSYARTGQPARTLATLEPMLQRDGGDAAALTIAGEAHMQTGDLKSAEAAFAHASKLDPKDPRSRTALAVMRLSKGDTGAAFGELESIAAADTGTAADLTLISAHLRRSEFDAALKAIDRLEKKLPDKPLAPYLRGLARLGMKQNDGARQSLEQALKVDAAYFPAVARLAAMDVVDKRVDLAQGRFEQLLKAAPGHIEGTASLAQLRMRAGASPDEVATLIGDSVKANPSDATPRLNLIAHHLATRRPERALAAAQEALTALPNNPQVLEALGRTQLANGDMNQALSSFGKLASQQPDSAVAPLRLAEVQLAMKNYEGARQSLKKALGLAPGSLDILQRMVALELAAGQPAQAMNLARQAQTQHAKHALGPALEGDIEASAKRWDAAAVAYRNSLKLQPTPGVAAKLHAVLDKAGRSPEAKAFAQKWLADHPRDTGFQGYLADAALARQDYAGAESLYLELLKAQPEDARALNNVAWIRVQTKAAGALEFARKAHERAPRNASIMETLGTALIQADQGAEAVGVLQKAIEIEPDNATVRLSLARAYLKSGQAPQARQELERLKQLGDKFPRQSEVAQLLSTI